MKTLSPNRGFVCKVPHYIVHFDIREISPTVWAGLFQIFLYRTAQPYRGSHDQATKTQIHINKKIRFSAPGCCMSNLIFLLGDTPLNASRANPAAPPHFNPTTRLATSSSSPLYPSYPTPSPSLQHHLSGLKWYLCQLNNYPVCTSYSLLKRVP